jgi:hypothetical protein
VVATEIYILRHGKSVGPYTVGAIRAFLANGSLTSKDLAWHEGLAGWVPVSSLAIVVQPHQTAKVVRRQKLTVARQPAAATGPMPKIVETRVTRIREQQAEMLHEMEGRHKHWSWMGPFIAAMAIFFLVAAFVFFKWIKPAMAKPPKPAAVERDR